jgi:2-(1,2-epoxy-1,2-dihydrophenyl)acetyl-CoA isomerase
LLERGKAEGRAMSRQLAKAEGPTAALGFIRRLYWGSPENSHEPQLDLEYRMQRLAGATVDFRDGVNAFLEKRPAKFAGA